jgi:DNA processing protein
MSDELHDHLALALVPGLGPKLTAALLDRFGSAAAARAATSAQLREIPHIGDKLADAFASALRTIDLTSELELFDRHGVRPVPLGLPGYPASLAGVPAPPPLIYLRGEWRTEDENAVGIVGSRTCTSYGAKVAAQLARGLVRAGYTIVSGLARGIDVAAHRAALEAGGRTVAVMAGGLSKIYPSEHTELAAEIAAGRGCLITEASMKMEPQPGLFPRRNRIISGLSRAVIVVEANARSGALITAQHAAEQGREVYAVPGQIDSPASAGCLELIRNGARLVRSADDVIEDLRGLGTPRAVKPERTVEAPQPVASEPVPASEPLPPLPELSPNEAKVFVALANRRHADDLTRELGLSISDLSRALMLLELKKLVRRLPGNNYEKK